ncbi:MAG: GNAT family N-acetyltransferase [Moraxellaceae bacterium]|nr:GNAT family N-acetyltransferase [Moraxellaceae bacterium]
MTKNLAIQLAREADSEIIAELVQSVAHYCLSDPSGSGAEGFINSISQESISKYINSADFIYALCFINSKLAGVAALRNNTHIYHLFVNPDFHRLGIGRKLWQFLKSEAENLGNPGSFTVNSSIFAVPVYSAFGFVPVGEPQVKNGVQFQPMQISANG